MNADPVVERLGALFAGSFHIEIPSPDTDLLESGILDSFQFVELLLLLEQNFSLRIRIDDIDLEDLRTLRSIGRLVSAHNGAAESPALRLSPGVTD
jgi:acyl carrier protein